MLANINGNTRLCGLMGNPVEHTLSPIIHNTLAGIYNHNLVYVPFLVEHGDVGDAVTGAHALNILGMNVTVPYKSEVIPFLSQIDEPARRIGAVNTLVRAGDGFKGYNTDVYGLARGLEAEGAVVEGSCIVILGAGGAARAAAFLCEDMGAARIYILNRTIDRAQSVAKEVNGHKGKEIAKALMISEAEKINEESFIAIQATSVGLSPNDKDVIIEDESFYSKIELGYDLVYRPSCTEFMRRVREMGGKAANGLSMLLYQGIVAYELWNDIKVDEDTAKQVYMALEEALGE